MEKYKEKMFKNNELAGKTILVTGGGTGLGKSMAQYYLELGANVIIASRKKEVIDETVVELTKNTGKTNIVGYECDVRDYLSVEKIIEQGITKFGEINGLVNNAAGNFVSPTERLSNKAFDVVTDIVLKGSYNCSLALGKYWIKNKIKGTVLNIVTTYSWTGSGYVVPSACAKAGVLALTRSLASEWAKYGIRNNAIAPGPFPTQGAFSRLFPENLAKLIDPLKRIPLKRFGDHQELTNLAAYLMSDFSAYINGEVVTIDAGEWIYNAGEFNSFDNIPSEMWDEVEKHVRGKK
ncbi:MAG: short-chain dehydrogenase [Bacteroidetes bacterium HGW-Bacteroidetes-12]|nr:MAG: short-chain dehydrogenase [Bacteroidetes bacterium HGW-Bacteroidetes-12]